MKSALSENKVATPGNSLAVQWLGLCAFTAASLQVQSLFGELRPHKPRGVAKTETDVVDINPTISVITLNISGSSILA